MSWFRRRLMMVAVTVALWLDGWFRSEGWFHDEPW